MWDIDFLTAARAEGGGTTVPEPAPVLTDRVLAGLLAAGLDVAEVLVGVFWDLAGFVVGRRPAPVVGVAVFEGVDIVWIQGMLWVAMLGLTLYDVGTKGRQWRCHSWAANVKDSKAQSTCQIEADVVSRAGYASTKQ